MAISSSSSAAALPTLSPCFEQRWPQQPLSYQPQIFLYRLWNYDGTPAILSFEKGTWSKCKFGYTLSSESYSSDHGQKPLCKLLPLFFPEHLGIWFFAIRYPVIKAEWELPQKHKDLWVKVRGFNYSAQHISLGRLQHTLLTILHVWIMGHVDFQFIKKRRPGKHPTLSWFALGNYEQKPRTEDFWCLRINTSPWTTTEKNRSNFDVSFFLKAPLFLILIALYYHVQWHDIWLPAIIVLESLLI